MAHHDVLLVTGCLPPVPCGVGHYTARLREALEKEGIAVAVETLSQRGHLKNLRERIRETRPQVVHFMYPSRGYARSLFPLFVPRNVAPARLLLGLHEYRASHPLRRLLVRSLAARSWRITVSTPAERDALLDFPTTIVPIPSSVIPDPTRLPPPPEPRVDPRPIEVVFFGFLNPRKGVDTLLDAAAIAQKRDRPVRLRLIGQTPPEFAEYRRDLEIRAVELGVETVFSGEISDPDVVPELRKADLCVLPFTGGASGRNTTLITALQAGVPVITTRGLDVPEGMTHGLHVSLVAPQNAEALATEMESLARDVERRKMLSREGARFASRFTWTAVAREFIRLYDLSRKPS